MEIRRRRQGGTGAVLAILVVLSGVLAILVAAVFVLFQANVSSYRYRAGRVRAQLAAESGVSLALHTLAQGDRAPSGEPYSMPGDSAQWIALPSGDRVWVVIDPSVINGSPYSVGTVEIRALGLAGEITREVSVRAAPDYPSRYALLTDMGIPPGMVGDGARFEGPVHSNGIVDISSTSPDSAGDPWVASISTTSRGGFRFCDAGTGFSPHPDGSRVWVRPYPSHRQGRPTWDPFADPVDFGRLSDLFADLRAAAADSGEVIWNARRLLIDGDRLLVSSEQGVVSDTVDLATTDLVYVASFSDVLVKTAGALTSPLTIVANGQIGLMGNIHCSTGEFTGTPLGLVSMSGICIPVDPDSYGGADWPPPWQIETDGHLTVEAFLCAPDGAIRAEDPTAGGRSLSFNVIGGLAVGRMGALSAGTHGYDMTIVYDGRLTSVHPPAFPSLEQWKIYSWVPDPDHDGHEIDEDLF